jgi:hypothetical protein
MARRTNRLRRFGVLPSRKTLFCYIAASRVERASRRIEPDVVLAMNAEHKIAFLPDRWPMVTCASAPFGSIADYYPEYAGLSKPAIRQGNRQEQRIIDSDVEIVPAAAEYDAPPVRFPVIPIGANFAPPRAPRSAPPRDQG